MNKSGLEIKTNCLGFELYDGDRLLTLYRCREEVDPFESPKPCFAPIYTPTGKLITEYRPADHAWHTGLYYGWVHANQTNLWGGPCYVPASGKYEYVPETHGRQAHESFDEMAAEGDQAKVTETITWRDYHDMVIATEKRFFSFSKLDDQLGTLWRMKSVIHPYNEKLTLAGSKQAGYSGLMLRMGPPFADPTFRTSEGIHGHEAIMGSRSRWCCASGACGGAVVLLDHPFNPRHPTCWFVRKNYMEPGLLMEGEIVISKNDQLILRYGLLVLTHDPSNNFIEVQYKRFTKQD